MDPATLRRRASAWADADPDPATAAELRALLAAGDLPALEDRLGTALQFGTAGLRGVLGAGSNRMNRAVIRRTTAGLARYLKATVPDAAARGVVLGHDARRGSLEFTRDAAAVLAAEGLPAHVFPGLTPTPPERIRAFQQRLTNQGIEAVVRRSRGLDISAACGQLRVETERKQRGARPPATT